MPSIMDAQTRRAAREMYSIDSFVFDHTVRAYDCLIAGDGDGFKRAIADANEAMGYGRTITEKDRPTAVDSSLGIINYYYAKQNGLDQRKVLPELKRRCGLI